MVLAATISDLKTKEIPNWINFSLVVFGLGVFSIYSISEKSISPILTSLSYFLIFLIIGNIMYYTKQWGGGDSKLLIGLGACLAIYPKHLEVIFNPKLTHSLPSTFLINLLIVGAIYGLIYTVILVIINYKKILNEFHLVIKKNKITNNLLILLFGFGILSGLIIEKVMVKLVIVGLFIMPLILIYSLIIAKLTEKITMHKKIKISKLVEGDWVIEKIVLKKSKKIIYTPNGLGITKKQIKLINQYKKEIGEKILIKDGVAFAPVFLISLILSITYGNILLYLI